MILKIREWFIGEKRLTKRILKSEAGAQAIEYIAVAVLGIALATAVFKAIQDESEGIGTEITEKIKEMITGIGDG